MKRTVLIGFAVLALVSGSLRAEEAGQADASRANNKFGITLFKTVQKRTAKGNKFLSPLSAYLALSMALNGASGRTQAEMEEALALKGLTRDDINAANLAMTQSLNRKGREFDLRIANSLWAREGFTLLPDYLARVTRNYDARLSVLDFRSPSAAATINAWVKEKTNGKIPEVIDRINDEVLFLINAIYFEAKWQHQFQSFATRNEPFTTDKGTCVEVPTMHQLGQYRHISTADGVEAVELPYGQRGESSMVVVLPPAGHKLAAVEGVANVETWDAIVAELAKQNKSYGTIELPMLKFEYSETLNESLQSMGMAQAFTKAADFSAITPASIMISMVMQKTFLGVNEEGTQAAAATVVSAVPTSVGPQPGFEMKVNRPYLVGFPDAQC